MSKKTVINRACKTIINSSDDSGLFEEEPSETTTEAHVKQQISDNANKKEIGFEEVEDQEEGQEEKLPKASTEEENQKAYEEALAEENKGPGF